MPWLKGYKKVESPNQNERPYGVEVDLLVIHSISLPPGRYGGSYIEDFFQNRLDPGDHDYFEEIIGLKVSSHFLIRRGGEIIQFVPMDKRAWHAGKSCWQGREDCNDYSIGIELEGTDTDLYTDLQYEKLVKVTNKLMGLYPKITKDRIVGHSDIAPERKSDPGTGFDWPRYKEQLEELT